MKDTFRVAALNHSSEMQNQATAYLEMRGAVPEIEYDQDDSPIQFDFTIDLEGTSTVTDIDVREPIEFISIYRAKALLAFTEALVEAMEKSFAVTGGEQIEIDQLRFLVDPPPLAGPFLTELLAKGPL